MELSADAIWLATAAVDMRTGIDGLSLHVQRAWTGSACRRGSAGPVALVMQAVALVNMVHGL